MDLGVITQTWMLVALAELGDKSQLLCMSLATRWPARSVFLGAALAFALLNTLAVGVGATVGELVNPALVGGVAGLLMVGLGVSMLLGDHEDDDADDVADADADAPATGSAVSSPLVRTAGLIALAELGDKTQLEVAALATVWPPVSVWTGATLALATTTGLGVWFGVIARDRLPTARLQQAGAVLLIAVGVMLLVTAARALPY